MYKLGDSFPQMHSKRGSLRKNYTPELDKDQSDIKLVKESAKSYQLYGNCWSAKY